MHQLMKPTVPHPFHEVYGCADLENLDEPDFQHDAVTIEPQPPFGWRYLVSYSNRVRNCLKNMCEIFVRDYCLK
jgi:hypothetical protein